MECFMSTTTNGHSSGTATKRNGLAFLAVILLMSAARTGDARPQFLAVLTSTYSANAPTLTTQSCANCHLSDSDFTRNPYGQAIEHEMDAEGTSDLTPTVLHKVESQTAPGATQTYLARITAGLVPWTVSVATPAPPTRVHHEEFPPSNMFHPIIVHFPIALFIAGLFLDLLGLFRGDRNLNAAGWYNLVLAAISALGALATGYASVLKMRVPLTGLIREHMLLAVAGTILMWVMVGLRVHRHEKINPALRMVYYVVAAVTCILISIAGHLGGTYVYGQ
jgi:uncharacterized membrane protein